MFTESRPDFAGEMRLWWGLGAVEIHKLIVPLK